MPLTFTHTHRMGMGRHPARILHLYPPCPPSPQLLRIRACRVIHARPDQNRKPNLTNLTYYLYRTAWWYRQRNHHGQAIRVARHGTARPTSCTSVRPVRTIHVSLKSHVKARTHVSTRESVYYKLHTQACACASHKYSSSSMCLWEGWKLYAACSRTALCTFPVHVSLRCII